MVRAIDRDFESLEKFLENYSLQGVARKANQLSVVKIAHKNYLPFLQLWAISSNEAENKRLSFFEQKIENTSQQFVYLREAVSDVGSGLFCCLHGAYKPGHMALRSSIENYLRFAAGSFDKNALTTTSVYELFDIARKTVPFAACRSEYLNRLRQSYVEQCKFSHSASLAHMAGIDALAHFPTFNEETFRGWVSQAKYCMESMATV